jgi:hypothetical protein
MIFHLAMSGATSFNYWNPWAITLSDPTGWQPPDAGDDALLAAALSNLTTLSKLGDCEADAGTPTRADKPPWDWITDCDIRHEDSFLLSGVALHGCAKGTVAVAQRRLWRLSLNSSAMAVQRRGVDITVDGLLLGALPAGPSLTSTACELLFRNTTLIESGPTTISVSTVGERHDNNWLVEDGYNAVLNTPLGTWPKQHAASMAECESACLKRPGCGVIAHSNSSSTCYFRTDNVWGAHETAGPFEVGRSSACRKDLVQNCSTISLPGTAPPRGLWLLQETGAAVQLRCGSISRTWPLLPTAPNGSCARTLKTDDCPNPPKPAAVPDVAVGLAACGSSPNQVFEPLSAEPLQPIKLKAATSQSTGDSEPLLQGLQPVSGVSSCISAANCAGRSPTCHLSLVPCSTTDPFQLFTYNASTGVVHVPPGAAGPKAPLGVPQCFNVNSNGRRPGFLLDVFTCAGGGSPGPGANAVAISQPHVGPGAGELRLRDAMSLCIAAGGLPPIPGPAPAPPPPRPNQPDIDHADLECGLRVMSYRLAVHNLQSDGGGQGPTSLRAVWDALGFSKACTGARKPPPRPPAPLPPRGSAELPPAGALFVDAIKGSDANAGTEVAPLKTVEHAVALAAQRPSTGGRSVVLRGGGAHYLDSTLALGPEHSGLELRSYPNESAELSGGKAMRLEFEPAAKKDEAWWAPAGSPLLVADLHGLRLPQNFTTELFVLEKTGPGGTHKQVRCVKARWPNIAQPDAGRCTTDGNCPGFTQVAETLEYVPFLNGTWVAPKGGKRDSWNVLRPDGSVAESAWWVLDHWVSLSGGSGAARFDPPETESSSAFGQTAGTVAGFRRSWQNRSRTVTVPLFSPRAAHWTVDAQSKPLLHAFNGDAKTVRSMHEAAVRLLHLPYTS